MKVKDLLGHMRLCSDVEVEIYDARTERHTRIFKEEMKMDLYRGFDNRRVNSFSVNDGKLTIYAE